MVDLICENNNERKIIILKSTVICGTTQRLNDKYDYLDIIFNPEFLTERNGLRTTTIKIELYWVVQDLTQQV